MKIYFIFVLTLLVSACASNYTQHRPDSYYTETESSSDGGDSSDLFGSERLSDTDIERILNHRLTFENTNRIAILKLSRDSYWRFYSDDFSELSDNITENFIDVLTKSERIYDAAFLPTMLIPEKRTIPFLREAAARYQADLLLVYRSSCQNYDKYRFLAADESKTYCNVEAALLDIRKGIVPFTAVSKNEVKAIENQEDMNFNETKKKAELKAIGKSLSEIADELVAFISAS